MLFFIIEVLYVYSVSFWSHGRNLIKLKEKKENSHRNLSINKFSQFYLLLLLLCLCNLFN